MGLYETLPIESKDDIRRILQISGVARCSVHLEKVGKGGKDGQHWTVFDNDTDGSSDNTESEDLTIYGIGSMTKPLIVLLLCIIVNKLSYSEKREHEKYRTLRHYYDNPWDVKFTDLFNSFSPTKITRPLPRNPTLRHVALHYNSFPPMNHILLAVDGTSIMSKQSFLRVAPHLAQIAYGDSTEDYNEYSNSNYIMIGYLIEAIGENSLAVLIHEHLCQPLGMNNTYIEAPDSLTSRIAPPYTISEDGTRNRVDPWPYRADSVVSAAFGARSCTKDCAILFRAILACLNGVESYLTKDLVTDLLKPEGILHGDIDAISLFGICTSLDTSTAGSRSFNRLVTPQDGCSTYRLGYKGGDKEVKAYYLAGATKGYSCSAYLLPKWKTFVIVLTNATAFSDASDHISRLILQKTFDLSFASTSEPSTLSRVFRKQKDTGGWQPDSTKVVDVIAMASLAAAAGKKLLQTLATEDAEGNTPNLRPIRLDGKYYNEKTEQTILITQNQAHIVGTASGVLETAQPMGFIRTGDWTIRLRPLSNSGFTIDRYDPYAWRNLNFDLSTGSKSKHDNRIMSISRKIPHFLDVFKRVETSSEESQSAQLPFHVIFNDRGVCS